MFANKISRLSVTLAIPLLISLAGCNASNFYLRDGLEPVSGAAIDATTSDNLTTRKSGSGNAEIDALAGGLVGGEIGKGLDRQERHDALQAEYDALEFTPSGDRVVWGNKSTGNHGSVTPSATYDVGVMNCRRYTHTVVINGKSKTAKGTACKEQYGSWHPLT